MKAILKINLNQFACKTTWNFIFSSRLAHDVLHAGIATHFCDSAKVPDLEHNLLHLENTNDVESLLNDFCPKIQSEFSLSKNLDQINECFNAASVEEILEKLEKDGSEWAAKTIKVISY